MHRQSIIVFWRQTLFQGLVEEGNSSTKAALGFAPDLRCREALFV